MNAKLYHTMAWFGFKLDRSPKAKKVDLGKGWLFLFFRFIKSHADHSAKGLLPHFTREQNEEFFVPVINRVGRYVLFRKKFRGVL